MAIKILHTNDLHGKLNEQLADKINKYRQDADFYFDCGDSIAGGNITFPIHPDPVWSYLEKLQCSASVPGNREFHISSPGFRAKLAGAKHPVLCANLVWNGRKKKPLKGNGPQPLPAFVEFGDVLVFGLMVPMVTPKMSARHVSAFLNTDPFETAKDILSKVKKNHSLVICLSHLGLGQDRMLAEKCQGIDLILGGHSHQLTNPPEKIAGTWICQTGSHGHYVGKYIWENGRINAEFIPLT
jgi:2',3'-cyclic-nucleotide 2'-phosphodiesterase (5'-nucleotidase family)